MTLTSIGDVIIHIGEPPASNPYRGSSLSGDLRRSALVALRDGGDTEGLTFWHAPTSGGARRIGSEDIDWRGMS